MPSIISKLKCVRLYSSRPWICCFKLRHMDTLHCYHTVREFQLAADWSGFGFLRSDREGQRAHSRNYFSLSALSKALSELSRWSGFRFVHSNHSSQVIGVLIGSLQKAEGLVNECVWRTDCTNDKYVSVRPKYVSPLNFPYLSPCVIPRGPANLTCPGTTFAQILRIPAHTLEFSHHLG